MINKVMYFSLSLTLVFCAVFDKTLSQHDHHHNSDKTSSSHHDHHHSDKSDDSSDLSNGRSAFKVLQNVELDDVCRAADGSLPEYVCMKSSACKYLAESIQSNNYLDICLFDGIEPIVCCPTSDDVPPPKISTKPPKISTKPPKKPPNTQNKHTNTAADKCREYNSMDYPKSDNIYIAVVGGTIAEAQEFPHMAALGYGDTTEDRDDFKCGGSLISERWILSAAHCHKDPKGSEVKWARLGDLDLKSTTEKSQPKDYRIVQHVPHPNYKRTENYHDIALFGLDSDVKFSSFVRPICLNADPTVNPEQQIATGWGKTGIVESSSDELLKITLDIVPFKKCNSIYFTQGDAKLKNGISPDSMICAGSVRDNEDTCQGDSGGPLQIKNEDDPDKLTQFGITSFGRICGDSDTPAVYTKVANYIQWIEKIVWPNN